MRLEGRVVVITGGGAGIGAALARRFAAERAAGIVIADLDETRATEVASETGGLPLFADVASEADIQRLVRRALEAYGRIDLFCSNAGISVKGGLEAADADWERIWAVNVKAHIYAARAVLPSMLARGQGYLLQTVSAAGLLTEIGSAPYSVTKHAAVALSEWLAVAYGDRGIKVSCLCPQWVKTDLLTAAAGAQLAWALEGALEPEQVAEAVVAGLAEEKFLILPHPEVAEYFRRKASDYDRWLGGMRRLRAKVLGA